MEDKYCDIYSSFDIYNNPTIFSPNSPYVIQFYQTRESLMDVEVYKSFLDNSISRFRHSVAYKQYKGHLYEYGLDRSTFKSNITNEMVDLEMHHNMINIFDIATIITEHIINTVGFVCTFDVVQILKDEHRNNHIQVVMLDKTSHHINHHSDGKFFIHPDMTAGNWMLFLEKYNKGITLDIAFKILRYLKRAQYLGCSDEAELLAVRDQIINWSELNGNGKLDPINIDDGHIMY